jgi:hypothetical protein
MNQEAANSGAAPVWNPRYTITPAAARGLMTIEAAKAVVERTPLSPAVEADLRQRARIRSTHYSTRIEGNRLTLVEAGQASGKRPRRTVRPEDCIAHRCLNLPESARYDWIMRQASGSDADLQRLVNEFLDAAILVQVQSSRLDEMNEKLRAARELPPPLLMSGEITV